MILDFIHRFQRIYVHNFPFPILFVASLWHEFGTHEDTQTSPASEQFPFLLRAWRRLCDPAERYDTIATFRRFLSNLHFNLQDNAHGTSIQNVSFLFLLIFQRIYRVNKRLHI